MVVLELSMESLQLRNNLTLVIIVPEGACLDERIVPDERSLLFRRGGWVGGVG